jgi:hypothetical protein
MSGEDDLGRILEGLEVRQRDGVFVFATIPAGQPLPDVPLSAMVSEASGTTLLLTLEAAEEAGLPFEYPAAWLSLTMHISLSSIGVSASIATAMAMKGVPCNVLSGFHHDHLLVPYEMVDEAMAVIDLVRAQRRAVG